MATPSAELGIQGEAAAVVALEPGTEGEATVGHDHRGNLEENPGAAGASKVIAHWEETYDGYEMATAQRVWAPHDLRVGQARRARAHVSWLLDPGS